MAGRESGETVADITRRLKTRDRITEAFNGRYKGREGQFLNNAGKGGGYVGINVDMSQAARKIALTMSEFGKELSFRAFAAALNHQSAIVYTRLKRELSAQTSAPYGKVSSFLHETKASPRKLEYRIDAKGGALPLKLFLKGAKAGGPVVVRVWRKQKTYKFSHTRGARGRFTGGNKGAFVLRLGGELVPLKRVGKGHGKGSVRGLSGPIIPKEMLRPGEATLHFIQREFPKRVSMRIDHEIEQALLRAKAKAGT